MQRPRSGALCRFPRLSAAALLMSLAPAALAQTAVSPADRTALEGSSFTHFPLGRPNARFQFLHGDLPPSITISGHAFRRDAVQITGTVDTFSADLEVTLSLSPNTPAAASRTFANNVGANPTVVLPRTVVAFPPTVRPTLDPTPTFDLVVAYQVPFVMPAVPATLCVDTTMFGNTSAAGVDRNLSVFLDAHEQTTNGTAEQPGFRTGSGCIAPGRTSSSFATMSLFHLGTSMQLDVAARNGVPDSGNGLTRTFVCLGGRLVNVPWPPVPACVLQQSTDLWFALPGNNDSSGALDGSIALPLLPAGYRLWCQAGSIDLGTGALALGDLSALITPPLPPSGPTAARVAASTDRTAATGTVAFSVPVTQFF